MIFLSGLGVGLALIVAIGAQNAFVLRQGIRREHVATVVAICVVSDMVLIWAGVLGMGTILSTAGWVVQVMRWLGVAYLLYFAARSVRSAVRADGALDEASAGGVRQASMKAVALTTISLTWLNPHVYLDTVIMLGGIANQYGPDKWEFSIGASVASVLWFVALGCGARFLSRYLNKPSVWRWLDLAIAVVMVLIAVRLILM